MAENKYICQECGCVCESCVNNNSIHLHREIELLKRQLRDRDYHIVQMETSVMKDVQEAPDSQMDILHRELSFWKDKYNRLFESHKKLQRVNQGLEDKLLKMVDKYETDKNSLTRDMTDLTSKLVSAQLAVTELEDENEQYRNDCNIAVHLLQCKPSSFVAHKFNSLPCDLQERVRLHLSHRSLRRSNTKSLDDQHQANNNNSPPSSPPEPKTIRVPIATFPPTAMVYSVSKAPSNAKTASSSNGNNHNHNGHKPDLVSVAIMAKVLEERAKERNNRNCPCYCKLCCCTKKRPVRHIALPNGDMSANSLEENLLNPPDQHKGTQTTIAYVHNQARARSHSGSSSDSNTQHYRVRNGSSTSTETII